jgi:hypothetical protein
MTSKAGNAYVIGRPDNKRYVDTRLVAKVQRLAGASVHETASALQSYVVWAHVLASAERAGDARAARGARAEFRDAEEHVRRLLWKLVTRGNPWLTERGTGRHELPIATSRL